MENEDRNSESDFETEKKPEAEENEENDLPQLKKKGKPNPKWLRYLELTYSEQCEVIRKYLGSMAKPHKAYPWFFNKAAKSTFRKSIKGYCLNQSGNLWFRSRTPLGGKCHAAEVLNRN